MLARRIAPIPGPERDQRHRREARPHQRALPAEPGHEIHDERRRECCAEAQPRRLQTLHEGPALGGKPRFEHPRGDRENGSLRQSEHELHAEQRREQCGRTLEELRHQRHGEGREKRGDSDHDEGQPRTQPLADDAAGQLEDRISQHEGLFDVGDLQLAQSERRHHGFGRHRDGLLLDVGQKSESEQKAENAPPDRERDVARRSAIRMLFQVFVRSSSQSTQICKASTSELADLSVPGRMLSEPPCCNTSPGRHTPMSSA